MLMCSLRVVLSPLSFSFATLLDISPWVCLKLWVRAVLVCQKEPRCEALFASVLGTASDAAHRSRMGLLSLYSSAGLARGS